MTALERSTAIREAVGLNYQYNIRHVVVPIESEAACDGMRVIHKYIANTMTVFNVDGRLKMIDRIEQKPFYSYYRIAQIAKILGMLTVQKDMTTRIKKMLYNSSKVSWGCGYRRSQKKSIDTFHRAIGCGIMCPSLLRLQLWTTSSKTSTRFKISSNTTSWRQIMRSEILSFEKRRPKLISLLLRLEMPDEPHVATEYLLYVGLVYGSKKQSKD